LQPKPGVISSVPGLSLAKGPLQIQVVGKGLPQLLPSVPVQPPQLYDGKLGSLKKGPTLQPSKEACFLEQLHKHQGAVLHPDYKTSFRSFEDALQRLLPYHVYQGMLPSAQDYRKVDEEFEVVSTQLLKRTQAMLNKYRLLLLEESRRVSPSAEMVMIDRMFIQEEKTMLALDKQLAKEKPDEYVSSSSRSQSLSSAAAPASAPASEGPKVPAAQAAAQLHPTKLVIKHGGGSPSVTWAKASPSLDGDEDALPSRSKPPIKTYEARSRIGLKLKIKQEAGLSKVVHNTALDPVHQPPPASRLPKAPEQPDDPTSGLMKELAEAEDEFYRGMIKPEPPDHGPGAELAWEVPLPPAKRRKSESFDVDNASFSSDSPQDDSLNEHLQSAIDSILNLQQPQAGGQSGRTPSSSYNSSSSPFSSPVHRADAYLAPSHNGGLGARTLNR
ncbi:BICRA protein, partial [Dromaius novaehollandiae]|nr:BICRA protein [Dromaius novaehollandiae]